MRHVLKGLVILAEWEESAASRPPGDDTLKQNDSPLERRRLRTGFCFRSFLWPAAVKISADYEIADERTRSA